MSQLKEILLQGQESLTSLQLGKSSREIFLGSSHKAELENNSYESR